MDTSALLAALAEGEPRLLLDALDWDAREDIDCPGMGVLVVGRIGTYGVSCSDRTGLDVHDHLDVDGAIECFTNKVRMLRETITSYVDADFARFLPDVQTDIEQMTGYVGRHEAQEPPRYI